MHCGKLLQMLLATASLIGCLSPAMCALDNQITDFLENLRKRMCHPIPNLGLPALDPLQLGHAETAADNKYLVNFTGSIDNFELRGLSDFIVNTLKISVIPGLSRSTINITLPYTYFKSLYTAKGSLAYIVNLAGDGHAEAEVKDFTFIISWRIKASVNIGIADLQIEMLLGDLKVDFENLFEEKRINDFVHALINEIGIELLGDIWIYVQDSVIEMAETMVNKNIGYILNLINGSGGGENPPIFEGVEPDCKKNMKFINKSY